MPEDFFADGFGEEQGIVFTKEEDQFLEKKIVFLDPMKTYQISIAKVLALLKYTKLDHESIKKILQNSCANGIGQKIITYDEMKKIFRGVALKQNKMEPSKINIEANIKTKPPVFYDDDDESEEEEQPKPQPQQSKPQEQKKSIEPPTQNLPTSQPPKVHAPVDPLKAYDEYWKNLKTKNNLIDGSEVKKLFSNNSLNKSNLSKAWKLCNLSEKGSLTKGEFFIFMNIINSNNIPETLTKEMKDFITKIEESCGYKKSSGQQSGQRVSSGPLPAQKQPEKRASDAFDKFGDESLFAKNASRVDESRQITKNSSNIFPASTKETAPGKSLTLTPSQSGDMSKSALFLLEKVETISKQEKVQEREIQVIAGNNQQLVEGLGAIEQFLAVVEKNMEATTSQIEVLKQTQNTLNERLNNVCLQFRNIITRQTECINFLKESMHAENESNNQRLLMLENYTQQMLSITETNFQNVQNETSIMRNQAESNFNKLSNLNQSLNEKSKGENYMRQNESPSVPKVNERLKSSPTSPEYQGHRKSDPFEDNEDNDEHEHNNYGREEARVQKDTTESVTHEQKVEVRIENTTQHEDSEPHIYLENLSPEERKKTKQMLLIRILNSVSSMNEEEYAQVVNKVVAMTEEQMNQSYTKLHALYLQSMAKNPSLPKYHVPTPEEFTAPQE